VGVAVPDHLILLRYLLNRHMDHAVLWVDIFLNRKNVLAFVFLKEEQAVVVHVSMVE
jgi:hypothetical protein